MVVMNMIVYTVLEWGFCSPVSLLTGRFNNNEFSLYHVHMCYLHLRFSVGHSVTL